MEKVYKLRCECNIRVVGDEGLLYDAHNKKVHVLNETGAVILSLIKDGKSVEEISAHVAEKYSANLDEVQADVQSFIKEFEDLGVIAC